MKVIETSGKPLKTWTDGVLFEDGAKKQLEYVAGMPFVYKWVAVMPDVHAGIGACVGTVIPCDGAIAPASVGVDIGCGMRAEKLTLKAADIKQGIREELFIKLGNAIPHGRTDNGGTGDRGAWGTCPQAVKITWDDELAEDYADLVADYPRLVGKNQQAASHQLGTLGTGNHFFELSEDEEGYVWMIVHSGSRGPGAKIGGIFTEIAKEQMERWYIKLPDANLAYLPEDTQEFKDYIRATQWAQKYAEWSRCLMSTSALQVMRKVTGALLSDDIIDCKHNYVEKENHFGKNVWVVRKGAIRARKGDLGIIPGSMGAKSYIVEGLGNKDSFDSCSHGAGRKMSRTVARNSFSVTDHEKATEGVVCLKDKSVLDETPGAYKPIEDVMEAQKDLVVIKHTLKQFLSIKGEDSGERR